MMIDENVIIVRDRIDDEHMGGFEFQKLLFQLLNAPLIFTKSTKTIPYFHTNI